MPIVNNNIDSKIQRKLEYLGLDLNNIPKQLKKYSDINFRTLKGYDEKKYKQYKFININDIEILISPTTRADSIKEKYEKALPLCFYLDNKNEENLLNHTKFLEMLNSVTINQIDEIEYEQKMLSKMLPFKVKFERNYLWQIYYHEVSGKYFMIVSTGDSDYSTFFYLLKKKIENNKNSKIFVPISLVDYEETVLTKQEIKDLENYLWVFTKDYPLIYEVSNKENDVSLEIIGETLIYDDVKTIYKVSLKNRKDAVKFYKLIKALFILQTELPYYFNFTTNINKKGAIEFYFDNFQIKYEGLSDFIRNQFLKSIDLKKELKDNIEELKVKLKVLKNESNDLEREYAQKEKQITFYLECKKSFLGKVKYFFKSSKVKPQLKTRARNILDEKLNYQFNKKENYEQEEKNYTLYELEESFKELRTYEEEAKKIIMDINALKLKNKNMKKKIQNATNYIEEINKHKKSIFEFWKYSNKDSVNALEEGEQEELNVTKIEKVFNFEEEFEKFGTDVDKFQRNKFTDDEVESIFISTKGILKLLNRMNQKIAENKEISAELKRLKENKQNALKEDNIEYDEFNIFGNVKQTINKEKNMGNKIHREQRRDEYQILQINNETKGIDLKRKFEKIIKNIKSALKKNSLKEDTYVYIASEERKKLKDIEIVDLSIENEINQFLKHNKEVNRFYLYKIKIPKNTNYAALTNIVFFDNKNMTLPVGMNLSTKLLINLGKLHKGKPNIKILNKLQFEDEENDFSKIVIKSIKIEEIDIIE